VLPKSQPERVFCFVGKQLRRRVAAGYAAEGGANPHLRDTTIKVIISLNIRAVAAQSEGPTETNDNRALL
jgi:hypothetical protein